MLKSGLYEQVINKKIDEELRSLEDKFSQTASIDKAESSKILTNYIAEIIQKGFDNVSDNGGAVEAQIELANKIVTTIINETREADFDK